MIKLLLALFRQPPDRAANRFSAANRWSALAFAALALNGCTTNIIPFPDATAEKGADKIIADIWQIPKNMTGPVNKP